MSDPPLAVVGGGPRPAGLPKLTTRRLAAILAADVVGFSSMIEKDEEGTLGSNSAPQV
jgi:class 3 adenylate cyclase